MRYYYEICCTIDLANSVGEVGTLMEGVNATLAKYGVYDKLTVGGDFTLDLSTGRELTIKEITILKGLVQQSFNESCLDVTVMDIRRKSGNVSQSAL